MGQTDFNDANFLKNSPQLSNYDIGQPAISTHCNSKINLFFFVLDKYLEYLQWKKYYKLEKSTRINETHADKNEILGMVAILYKY